VRPSARDINFVKVAQCGWRGGFNKADTRSPRTALDADVRWSPEAAVRAWFTVSPNRQLFTVGSLKMRSIPAIADIQALSDVAFCSV
jgi:hypothetical protein